MEVNYTYKARMLKPSDGDTFWAEISLGFRAKTVQKLRLARINCPEKSAADTAPALAAQAFTIAQIGNADLRIMTKKSDNWDRWLAEVYYTVNGVEKNLSDELLKAGHAIIYKPK